MKVWVNLAVLLGACAWQAGASSPCAAVIGFPSSSGSSSTKCSMAVCNDALNLNDHAKLIEFLDACRSDFSDRMDHGYGFVEKVMAVAVDLLPREQYMNFAFLDTPDRQREAATSQTSLEGINIAAVVLGYGCAATSKTKRCQNLTVLRPGNTGLLGMTPEEYTAAGLNISVDLNTAVRQCIATGFGYYEESEWENGMSQCAIGSTNSTKDSLSHYVANVESKELCSKCTVDSAVRAVPFCSPLYSQQSASGSVTDKFAVRCHRANVADRISQNLVFQWKGRGKAEITDNISISGSVSGECESYLQELVCETVVAPCDQNGMVRPCKDVCEQKLANACGLSAAMAAEACRAVNASRTGGTCTGELTGTTSNGSYSIVDGSATARLFRTEISIPTAAHTASEGQSSFMAITFLESLCQRMNLTKCASKSIITHVTGSTTTIVVTFQANVETPRTNIAVQAVAQQVVRGYSSLVVTQSDVPESNVQRVVAGGSSASTVTASAMVIFASIAAFFL